MVVVKDRIGEVCYLSDMGQDLYKEIEPAIAKGEPVLLDFSGVELVTACFLNSAIGQLYSYYSSYVRVMI
jgi:hypothetical protein